MQMCQKGGTKNLLNSHVMRFDLGGYSTMYSLMQLLSTQEVTYAMAGHALFVSESFSKHHAKLN